MNKGQEQERAGREQRAQTRVVLEARRSEQAGEEDATACVPVPSSLSAQTLASSYSRTGTLCPRKEEDRSRSICSSALRRSGSQSYCKWGGSTRQHRWAEEWLPPPQGPVLLNRSHQPEVTSPPLAASPGSEAQRRAPCGAQGTKWEPQGWGGPTSAARREHTPGGAPQTGQDRRHGAWGCDALTQVNHPYKLSNESNTSNKNWGQGAAKLKAHRSLRGIKSGSTDIGQRAT